jgi:hypothetical protein
MASELPLLGDGIEACAATAPKASAPAALTDINLLIDESPDFLQ